MRATETPAGSGVFAHDPDGQHVVVEFVKMKALEDLLGKLIEHYGFPSNYRNAKTVFDWMKDLGFFQDFDDVQEDVDERL